MKRFLVANAVVALLISQGRLFEQPVFAQPQRQEEFVPQEETDAVIIITRTRIEILADDEANYAGRITCKRKQNKKCSGNIWIKWTVINATNSEISVTLDEVVSDPFQTTFKTTSKLPPNHHKLSQTMS